MRERFVRCPGGLRTCLGAEAGISLVEVLVAGAILTLVLLPMLDFSTYLLNGQAYERQMAATLAAAKLEELQSLSYRTNHYPNEHIGWPGQKGEDLMPLLVGNRAYLRSWIRSPMADSPAGGEQKWIRKVSVKVECLDCSEDVSVEVVGYIAKVLPSSTSSHGP